MNDASCCAPLPPSGVSIRTGALSPAGEGRLTPFFARCAILTPYRNRSLEPRSTTAAQTLSKACVRTLQSPVRFIDTRSCNESYHYFRRGVDRTLNTFFTYALVAANHGLFLI